MNLEYSFVIPVFNRPDEVRELLQSMSRLEFDRSFEVVIVEDGSTISSEEVVTEFLGELHISYYSKPNSGPGDSRNFGMQRAEGNYFLILDSDVILPEDYLKEVDAFLRKEYCDCFGGPDGAHKDFSDIQKAIDYSMTSVLTTGGIRGKKKSGFQPRSFNMGLSRKAFESSGGFGQIHPGEDPDLALRLKKGGFRTCLARKAVVYHKRRIDWKKFHQQVHKFGLVRPILNKWHPGSAKITYWFPSVFILGFIFAILLLKFHWIFLGLYLFYFLLLATDALMKTGSLKIAGLAIIATVIQFYGYGTGFLESVWQISVMKREPQKKFPKLFFKK